MSKRSTKPRDLNSLAAAIVNQSVSDEPVPDPDEAKNPHAVALGRAGGLKGGKARAEALTPGQRSKISRRAAQARWSAERATDDAPDDRS